MTWLATILLAIVCFYLIYVCTLFRVAFHCNLWRSLPANNRAGQNLELLLKTVNMDCESVMIWESQLPVLKLLQKAGTRGIRREEMCLYFRNFSHSFPELAEGSQPENWLQILLQEEVITTRGRNFTITEKGLFVLNLLEYQKIHPCEERAVHHVV